jgi:Na+-driven multidrug efflux pump
MLVVFLVIHAKGVSKQLQLYKHWSFDAVNTRLILVQSSPLVFQYSLSIMAWVFFYILIEHHGRQALAISNTMRNIFGLFGVFTWAFASTTNAMVSNIIGQGKQDQVWLLIRKMIKLSFGSAVVIAILLNLFPDWLFSIYGQSGEFIEQAVPCVRVLSVAIVVMSFSVVFLNSVTGSGNTRVSLLIELFAIVLYCLYIYFTLDKFNLSITYGWMSEWLYWICLFLPSYFYMKSGKWKGKKM